MEMASKIFGQFLELIQLVKNEGLLQFIVVIVVGTVLGAGVAIFLHLMFGLKWHDIERVTMWYSVAVVLAMSVSWGFLHVTIANREKYKKRLEDSKVDLISAAQYTELLAEWNASGQGSLLMYNIELQTFESREKMLQVWGKIADHTNIESVIMLLPPDKFRRWEKIVLREMEDGGFFTNESNRKFNVCKISEPYVSQAPHGIAFAVYRQKSSELTPRIHEKAALFILSSPFSELQPPRIPGEHSWWNYQIIFRFIREDHIIDGVKNIWKNFYRAANVLDVQGVFKRAKTLEPLPADTFFRNLGMPPKQIKERMRYLGTRDNPIARPAVVPQNTDSGKFKLEYGNGDVVVGHYSGVAGRSKRPAIIWIGGFTETEHSRLPGFFENVLKRDKIVQFHYQVSPPIEDISVTRYLEDMQNVLRYAKSQVNVIDTDKVVVVARSVNAFVAAKMATDTEMLEMLGGLVLVAPVFDVVQMMDNYRASRGCDHVRIENAWRAIRGYDRWDKWEDTSSEKPWLEFFRHNIRLTLLGDIVSNDPDAFSFETFKEGVSAASHEIPVYILTHEADPITGSSEATQWLRDASGGTGKIHADNFKLISIRGMHQPASEIDRDQYPFENAEEGAAQSAIAIREEVKKVQNSLREIFANLGMPVKAED